MFLLTAYHNSKSIAPTAAMASRGFLVGVHRLSTAATEPVITNKTQPSGTGKAVVASTQSLPPSKKSFNPEDLPVTFSDISRAHVRIRSGVKKTTCDKSFFLSELVGANVFLKTEFSQFTGSFKERGARNAILQLKQEQGSALKGVIAASAGNHALALAYHGKELGVPVTVVMPTVAPLAKVDKCRKFNANIIIHGAHIGEAKLFAEGIVEKEGLVYVNGYDDPPIVAGAGTIGVEIIEAVPCVDYVVVPVGGAGLIAGIACAIKTLKPSCKVHKLLFLIYKYSSLLVCVPMQQFSSFFFFFYFLFLIPFLRSLESNPSSPHLTLLPSRQANQWQLKLLLP